MEIPSIPDSFNCPITHECMIDPVVAADSFTYEKEAILKWLSIKNTSPMTNKKLDHKFIIPNQNLKSYILDYKG